MNPQRTLVAGPYRSGTNDDPVLIASNVRASVGAVFAVLTAAIFTLLGCFSAQRSNGLSRRPKAVAAANGGAGFTFIAAGLSILALEHRP